MYIILGEIANIAVKVILLVGVIGIIKRKIDASKTAEEKMTDRQKEIRQKEMDRYSGKLKSLGFLFCIAQTELKKATS